MTFNSVILVSISRNFFNAFFYTSLQSWPCEALKFNRPPISYNVKPSVCAVRTNFNRAILSGE